MSNLNHKLKTYNLQLSEFEDSVGNAAVVEQARNFALTSEAPCGCQPAVECTGRYFRKFDPTEEYVA